MPPIAIAKADAPACLINPRLSIFDGFDCKVSAIQSVVQVWKNYSYTDKFISMSFFVMGNKYLCTV